MSQSNARTFFTQNNTMSFSIPITGISGAKKVPILENKTNTIMKSSQSVPMISFQCFLRHADLDLLNSFYTNASRYFNAFDFIHCFNGLHWYKAGQEETPWLAGPSKQFKSKKRSHFQLTFVSRQRQYLLTALVMPSFEFCWIWKFSFAINFQYHCLNISIVMNKKQKNI